MRITLSGDGNQLYCMREHRSPEVVLIAYGVLQRQYGYVYLLGTAFPAAFSAAYGGGQYFYSTLSPSGYYGMLCGNCRTEQEAVRLLLAAIHPNVNVEMRQIIVDSIRPARDARAPRVERVQYSVAETSWERLLC